MINQRKLIIITAVVLAIITAATFIRYSRDLDTRVEVVVAKNNIEVGDVLSKSNIELTLIHPDNVVRGSYKSLDELLGKKVLSDIAEGEQIAKIRVTDKKVEFGDAVSELLNENKVAIGIPSDLINTVGGQLNEGNKVIVYGMTNEGKMVPLVYDTKVLKIVSEKGETKGEVFKNAGKRDKKEFIPVGVVLEVEENLANDIINARTLGSIVLAVQSEQEVQ